MSKPSVYLAGPISGKTYDDSQGWRKFAAILLAPEIAAFSPLRGKQFLRKEGTLEGSYDYATLSTVKGITTRDRFDTRNRDLILVNFRDWAIPSVGTIIELGWADALGTPVVGIGSHQHPMVQEIVGFWSEDIEDAVATIKSILLP